ncbi:unnamed protein product [Prunus brigantina]
MGLKNIGEDVELDSPVEDEKVKQLCKNADEDFKVRFVMFALGTVLCPTSSPSVTGNYLTFLMIPGKIKTKNWADHGFKFLFEGVRSFKAKKVAYINGKQGGFDSTTVRVVSKHRPTNEVSGVNLERIVEEVSISLAPVIQAEVKRSIEGLALGPIIQADVQRSVLELTDKVMSQVSSFMKDARQHIHPGHEYVNQCVVLMLVGFVGAMCVCLCVFLLFCLHPSTAIYSMFVVLFNTTSDDLMYSLVSDINKRTAFIEIMSCYCIVLFLVKTVTILFDVEVEIICFIVCFEATMRTKNKCIEGGASHKGSPAPKTTLAKGTKGNSSVASSSSNKWKPTKQISGPMGIGVFGVRVFKPRDHNPCSPLLHLDLEEHISFKLTLTKIRGCGNNDKCARWYNVGMHDMVKAKVKKAGFVPFLSILGHGKKGDRPLLVALAERWWDTTHTFRFDEVGEMTMTPTDFAAITGLRVGGKRLKGRSSSMGGYWRAWEVWACEYLKPFALSRPSGTVNTWPRTLRWVVGAKSKRDLQHHLEHFKVMMRHLTKDKVNWNPWGTNESDLPEEVKNTVLATRKRILLEGPAGSAWFLGERVTMQSLGTTEPQVPKIPPRTMLSDYQLIDELEFEEELNGYLASEWLANSSDYAQYRDEYIRYRHYADLCEALQEQHQTPRGAKIRVANISPQPWSVRIPC